MWWKVLLLAWVSLHVQAYGLLLSAGDVGCDRNGIELECRYDDVSEVCCHSFNYFNVNNSNYWIMLVRFSQWDVCVHIFAFSPLK